MHRHIHCNQSSFLCLQMTRPEHINDLLLTLRVHSDNKQFDYIANQTLDRIIVLLLIYSDELYIDERLFQPLQEPLDPSSSCRPMDRTRLIYPL